MTKKILLFLIGVLLSHTTVADSLSDIKLTTSSKQSVLLDRLSRDIAVMSLNLWNEGRPVGNGGYDAIVNEIAHHYTDFVVLCEIRNYRNTDFIDKLLASLKEKGVEYYANTKSDDVGILSKYPITSSEYPVSDEVYSITTEIENVKFKLYSMHLDFRNYTAYLPRGLDGTNGTNVETLPEPVSDLVTIQAMNLASGRDDAIKISIEDAKADIEAGTVVIMAGDFNEPSHLDWDISTREMYDHNGVVYNWDVSMMMQNAGYIDSYREIYKSAVTHPGFTYPSFQARASYKVDIRDRIDFIYYYPNAKLKLLESSVYGPLESRVRKENIAEDTEDTFILPLDIWPSDHKGVISKFKLYLD